MPFDAGVYGISRRSMTSVLPSTRGGHATCGIPIGSFLGQPKGAQAHCFIGLGLPLVLVGRQNFHMYSVCHLERILGSTTTVAAVSAMQLSFTADPRSARATDDAASGGAIIGSSRSGAVMAIGVAPPG